MHTSEEKLFACMTSILSIIGYTSYSLIFFTPSNFMLALLLCIQMEEYVPGLDNQPQQFRNGSETY